MRHDASGRAAANITSSDRAPRNRADVRRHLATIRHDHVPDSSRRPSRALSPISALWALHERLGGVTRRAGM